MFETFALPSSAIIIGLASLLWSAEKFVGGAGLVAKHLKVPAILIGMLIVGFGTSMPEMVISGIASSNGSPGLALGNAFGSNITNIALILGLTAVISPIKVASGVIRKELPILISVTLFSALLILDSFLSRLDALALLLVFMLVIGWSIFIAFRHRQDSFSQDIRDELSIREQPLVNALFWLVAGLLVLVVSSRLFVWGAVSLAETFGVSDLVIGLTIVAFGTSLPELAATLVAIRRNEHDLALGNVLGSNLFNTLAVVGIAGVINPFGLSQELLYRDLPVMVGLTLLLYLTCYQFRAAPFIKRWEGGILLFVYLVYMSYLIFSLR